MDWGEVIRTVASGGTVVAVLIAARQLLLNRRQARATFEDDLSREYRTIIEDLPSDAFFVNADRSAQLTESEQKAMFRYFDLSNEQLRFCHQGRISKGTAKAWREGIEQNLALPRFEQAWSVITSRIVAETFTCLYELRAPAPAGPDEPHAPPQAS